MSLEYTRLWNMSFVKSSFSPHGFVLGAINLMSLQSFLPLLWTHNNLHDTDHRKSGGMILSCVTFNCSRTMGVGWTEVCHRIDDTPTL